VAGKGRHLASVEVWVEVWGGADLVSQTEGSCLPGKVISGCVPLWITNH
jgi:hypothetical protein